MSTTLEIIPLEGLDLEGTPPCGCLWILRLCGNPSAFRIISTCPACMRRGVLFICHRCHDWVKGPGAACADCWNSTRGIDQYL
jgi:hypothetical protein